MPIAGAVHDLALDATKLFQQEDSQREAMTNFRSALGDFAKGEGRLVITIDHSDHCLQMYPLPEWEAVEQKISDLPSLNPQVRRLKRMLLGYATECEMDNNGRILLPAKLREFAALQKSMVMIGQGNKFELWDEETWNSLMDECLQEDFDGILPTELESLSI